MNSIGVVEDLQTGKVEFVKSRTSNSFLVTRTRINKSGIDTENWFDQHAFKKAFKVLSIGNLLK